MKLGKKGKARAKSNTITGSQAEDDQIGRCERCQWAYENGIKLPSKSDRGLFVARAHSHKGRNIDNWDKFLEVGWLCRPCHREIDEMPDREVEEFILMIIERRTPSWFWAA